MQRFNKFVSGLFKSDINHEIDANAYSVAWALLCFYNKTKCVTKMSNLFISGPNKHHVYM